MALRILVIGASQGTGALAVKEALARGHQVTAFARSPGKLDAESPNLTRVAGDFHDPAALEKAVPGHGAVIVTASAGKLSKFRELPDYFSRGTALTIAAMKRHDVRRLVVLSALGAGDSRPLLSWPLRKLMLGWILKIPYADHDRQEAMARESGLEWVIARPTRLTDGAARRRYVATRELKKVPGAISRADVASFLVDAAEKPDWLNSAVQLGG